jgi:hypothetical protein
MAGLVPEVAGTLGRLRIAGDDTAGWETRLMRMRLGLLIGVRDRAVVLDQVGALVDEEFVLAIRAQKLDAGVAQVFMMDMEFLVALGAAGIEMLDHLGLLVGVLYGHRWLGS